MAYSKYRQHQHLPLVANRTNNTVLLNIWIPANVVVRIFRMFGYMTTAGSAAGCAVDLKQDGGAQLSTVARGTGTGLVESSSTAITTTTPLVITATSSGSVLQLVQDTTDTTGVGTVWLDLEFPFV